MGVKVKSFQVDIKDYDTVKSWLNETKELFDGLDIIINNAGIIKDKALALMEPEDWHEVIHTNLDGIFNLTSSHYNIHKTKKRQYCKYYLGGWHYGQSTSDKLYCL